MMSTTTDRAERAHGQAAREGFLRPLVPLDGGWVVVDLGIDKEDPVSVAGGFLTTTVPLWVELVYGYDVVLAAQQLLTEVEDAEDSRQLRLAREVPTTWHSAPTMTARVLCRIAQGLWMRRYWPSPVGSPIARPDRDLLAVELASLSLRAEAPECFGPGGLTGVLLDGHATAVPELARRVLEGRADETSQRRLRVILRDVLAWLCEGQDLEAVEPDADRERGDADELLELYSLRDDLAHSVPARGWEQVLEEIGRADVALAAGAPAEDEAPEPPAGAGACASRDSVDWEVNAPGLLDTDTGAVVWSADDGELRVTAPLAPSAGRALPHAYARVYFEGEDLPALVDLHPDASGRLLTAHETLERSGRVECVDVVSVPRPAPALRGPERAAMVRDQEAATEWARRRAEDVYDFLEETFPYEGRGLPDDPVPEGLAGGEPWVGQLVGPSGDLSL